MTVFYADDDAEDRELFCEAIQQINPGIKPVLASDGREALEMLINSAELPRFIFLDINMPVMTGKECLIKLKSTERFKKVPVIIYSTTTDKDELKKLILLGAHDYVIKPNSFDKLVESIKKILTKEYSTIL
jgi:CheY-like chemotaxis protein